MRFSIKRAVVVGSSAALFAMSASVGSVGAQQALLAPMVQVAPANMAAGNITFHGLAVECRSGQPATRVAVYDGGDLSAPYVGDAAIDTSTDLGAACEGQAGTARAGFTLILDSRRLTDGAHSLMFVAEYPDGASATGSTQLVLQNMRPYETQESSSD